MQNRWAVLALLFTVRLAMAFQFQAVGAVSPAFMQEFGVALADIGLLISLYLAPGIVFAISSGEIGRRFGDKSVLFGLALMTVGGVIMAFAASWHLQLAGRLVAGTGGVLINVLMSKMVADRFVGKETATAMAIFVNSWPAGIALALVVLPALARGGVFAAAIATVVFSLLGLMLLALTYRPKSDAAAGAGRGIWPSGATLGAVLASGCIWGLFNAALGMVFGYGTALLTERGWTLTSAGSATSLVLWVAVLSVPIGGLLADRTGRPRDVMLAGFILSAVLLYISARTENVVLFFALVGLAASLPPGPIMSLPGRVLAAEMRATGMGLYYTMFYLFVVGAPIVAGYLSVGFGTSRAAFDLGVAMLLVCCPLVWLFEHLARHVRRDVIAPA